MINNNNYDTRPDFSDSYLGNYRLVRLLGHGGFAAVFLGEHRYLQRPAAIKVLRTVLADQEKEHFLAEARLLANLSHPHIVRVLEFAITQRRTVLQNSVIIENIPFLVMDYISGGSLRTVYPAGMRLFLDTVIGNVKQIAETLHYAHTQRIIHRDIKPENLLLNERQEIMLSDFGLALFAPQPGLLSRQDMAGTLPYTAPEQLRGKPVFASDQYSLGIVAYEWLCGYPPFRGGDTEIIMQHISSPPPPLQSHNVFIPKPVEDVILKALAKEPEQRYATMQEFAQALQNSYEQHSSIALQPSPTVGISQQATNPFPFFYYLSQQPTSPAASNINFAAPSYAQRQANILKPTSSMQRNRQRMLQKVRAFWIDGVLQDSLHEGTFITPGLREKQDAVAHTWPAALYQPKKPEREISILEAYEQAGGELLILGEAGSGKTTLLLQLARHLLDHAEQDEGFPIPVVFQLSSWAVKQLPLDQWLIEELNNKYQVPRPLASQWLHSEILLPLLDGLDEITANARSSCITAINAYKKLHGLNPLVVCSRLTEYLLFPPRVLLQRAIVVQPLTLQQVDDYFQNVGENFAAIYTMLRSDPLLYGLITTPLMLNIITLAYQNRSPADLLPMRSSKERHQKILDTYVDQMQRRHPAVNSAMTQQSTARLAYLARKMQQQRQVVFYIEQMQPTWIDRNYWLRMYEWLAVLLPGALIGALTGILANVLLFHAGSIGSVAIDSVYGIVMGYLFSNQPTASLSPEKPTLSQKRLDTSSSPKAYFKTALFVGLISFLCLSNAKGWTAGLANGLFLAILSIPIQKLLHKNSSAASHRVNIERGIKHPLSNFFPFEHFKNSFFIGLACGLTSIITLLVNHSVPGNGFIFLVTLGIRDSLRNILLGILLSLLLTKNNGVIYCAEVVSWSWKKFWKSFKSSSILYNLLIGIVIGAIFGSKQLFQGNLDDILSAGLSTGLLIMIGIRLVSAILEGISSNSLNNHHRTVPNEGIKRSLHHGTVSFIIGAILSTFFTIITSVLSFVLASGLVAFTHKHGLQTSLSTGLVNSFLLAPAGGLLAALLLGWLATFQHGILRLILRITGAFPLKLSPFLDYATDCALLRRAGGGYIFIHRTLLEYFAEFEHKQTPHRELEPSRPEPLARLL